jgi:PKD repeat protein
MRSNLFRQGLIGFAAAALFAALPAAADQYTSTAYQCTVNVAGATNDCVGPVLLQTNSGNQRTLQVNLSGGYVRLDAFVDVCNPTGWWIHFGDSPGNDGGGGDGGQTYHDAETYFTGTTFYTIGTFNYSQNALDPIVTNPSSIPASGCRTVQYTIQESRVDYDDDGDPSDAAMRTVQSLSLFEAPPYNESDSEDPNGNYANYWYAGINRTYADASRSGTGVNKVCYVLSKTASPSPSTLTSLCSGAPVNQPPVACFSAFPTSGNAPLDVNFDASCSYDPENLGLTYSWTFGDGGSDTGVAPFYTYYTPGSYSARLTVTDNLGQTSTTSRIIRVFSDTGCTKSMTGAIICPVQ